MTYEEAVKNGLEAFIAKPGEKIKPISDVDIEELVMNKLSIPDELLKQWGLNDVGEPVILDH